MERNDLSFDEIGPWSEVKLEILRKYAAAFTKIIASNGLHAVYVDGFAGGGFHVARDTGDVVEGSPWIALRVEPRFEEWHFIDLDDRRTKQLESLAAGQPGVHVYHGDCNAVLRQNVLPSLTYHSYRRALCLLDPYGLHLDWDIVAKAGHLGTVDLFLNFPIMDINRNVLRKDPGSVSPRDRARMTAFWGDESWRDAAYGSEETLFGPQEVKGSNEQVVQAYRERLRTVGGFGFVPEPLPMRNSSNAEVYYLFFASAKDVAGKIVRDIFKTYRTRRA